MELCTRRGRTVCLILTPSARTAYWFYGVLSFSRSVPVPKQLLREYAWRRGVAWRRKKPSVTAMLQLLDFTHLETGLQRKSYLPSFQEFCEQHPQRAFSQKTTPFCGGPHPTPAGSQRIQPVQPSVGGWDHICSDRLSGLPKAYFLGNYLFFCLILLPALPSTDTDSLWITKACLVTKVTFISSWGISLWGSLKTTKCLQ